MQLAKEKEPVLQANRDLEAIRSFNEREEALMAKATQAEQERTRALEGIAAQLGVSADSLTVSALAAYAAPPMRETLQKAARELAAKLQELRAQNNINRQLLEINLSFAAFLLDTMAREESLSSTYGASGGETEPSASGIYRFLDSEI
ncbi:MAG: flagellar protein FlgN [Clostridia bacterium]|nr:flagellar protein FlgN [Clostridia bacterium]